MHVKPFFMNSYKFFARLGLRLVPSKPNIVCTILNLLETKQAWQADDGHWDILDIYKY